MKCLLLIFLFLSAGYTKANTIFFDDDYAYTELTVAFLTADHLNRDDSFKEYFPGVVFDEQIFTSRLVVSFEKENNVFVNLLAIRMVKSSETERVLTSFKSCENILWAKRVLGHKRDEDPRENISYNDPMYAKQNHHKIMQNELAWNLSTGEGVVVAITDDGANLNHPDLVEGLWVNQNEIPGNKIDDDLNGFIDDVKGWNFIHLNNQNHETRLGHGTHVTGIVGARLNNGIGVVGTAPESIMMPLKFFESFDSPRNWSALVICEAYVYAIDNGAKIITTSYSIDAYLHDEVYQLALDYAYNKGVLVFNSAGNSGMDDPLRSEINKILLVGSTQIESSKVDVIAGSSNYGVGVDLFAPGENIFSTSVAGDYVEKSGTSMASPNAAAVAALIWAQHPSYTHEQVAAKMLQGCDDIEGKNKAKYKFKLGAGRVNSFQSLQEAMPGPKIRRVVETTPVKIIIQINSVFSKASFKPNSFQLTNLSTGQKIPLQMMEEYFYGTNLVEFQFGHALKTGKYEFKALAGQLKDPFGKPLAGGDFIFNFKI